MNARCRFMPVVAAAGLVLSACGGGGTSGSRGPPSDCAGNILDGDHPGRFVCYAVADYYTKGVWSGNSLVRALNEVSEKTHIRLAGVRDLGIQVEIAGEALAGTYTDRSMPETKAYVDLEDGRVFDHIVEMVLTLDETRFDHQETSRALAARVFEIHGSVSFTVAGGGGEQPAVEDVPAAPAVDQSPAATPAPEAVNGAAPGGDAAGQGAETGGGTGGGAGRGHGTGTGDGTGSGIGTEAGDGKGTGTGSGTGSNVAILDGPRPPYPPMARRAGWQGVVVLNVIVAPDGSAASVTVRATSGRGVLDDAAVKAVRLWRFSPATRAGDPIARRTELAVRFRLDEAQP